MLTGEEFIPRRILQIVAHTAVLSAGTTIGTAAAARLGDEAATAVGDAESAVDKALHPYPHPVKQARQIRRAYLAREHHLLYAKRLEGTELGVAVVVALGAGMEGDGWQLLHQQPHILYDQCIGTGAVEIPRQGDRLGELLIRQDRIERHVDPGTHLVCLSGERRDVLQGDPGGGPSAKLWRSDIDRIRSRRECYPTTLEGRSGRQYFDAFLHTTKVTIPPISRGTMAMVQILYLW